MELITFRARGVVFKIFSSNYFTKCFPYFNKSMLPIVSITDLINGVIAAAIAVRLALMLRGHGGDRRDGLLEFIGFYAFFALFWLSFSSPDLILDTAYRVTISTIIGYVFLFIALTFVVQMPFIFFDKRWLGVII